MTTLPYHYIANLVEEIPEIPAKSILSQTVYTDDQIRVTLFAFAAGEELTEHSSGHPAMLHFIEGEAELTLGDEAMTAQAGTWVHMAPRLPHSIRATTPTIMLLLMLTSK